LLESLRDIQIAHELSDKKSDIGNIIDANYKKLNCDMEHVDSSSKEYKLIQEFVTNTKEHRDVEIVNAFKLNRHGEKERYIDHGNKMLLWHGSRLTNFVGILS